MKNGDIVRLKKGGERMVVVNKQINERNILLDNLLSSCAKKALEQIDYKVNSNNDKLQINLIETKWVDVQGILNSKIFHINELELY